MSHMICFVYRNHNMVISSFMTYRVLVTRVTWRVTPVETELLTLHSRHFSFYNFWLPVFLNVSCYEWP